MTVSRPSLRIRRVQVAHEGARRVANRGGAHRALQHGGEEGAEELVRDGPQLLFALLRFLCRPGRWSTRLKLQRPPEGSAQVDGNVAKIDLAARGVDGALVHFNAPSWAVRAVMSSTTLPVCPKTGSTSPSLTVHLCLHTAPGNRECAHTGCSRDSGSNYETGSRHHRETDLCASVTAYTIYWFHRCVGPAPPGGKLRRRAAPNSASPRGWRTRRTPIRGGCAARSFGAGGSHRADGRSRGPDRPLSPCVARRFLEQQSGDPALGESQQQRCRHAQRQQRLSCFEHAPLPEPEPEPARPRPRRACVGASRAGHDESARPEGGGVTAGARLGPVRGDGRRPPFAGDVSTAAAPCARRVPKCPLSSRRTSPSNDVATSWVVSAFESESLTSG